MEGVKTSVLLTCICSIWTNIGFVTGTSVFRDCGGRLTNPAGIIQSPNFPKQFPTPIKCEWVIYNPQTMKTVLYLTQFYLSDHVQVLQYDHYSNEQEYIGEELLATIDFKNNIYSITVNRPYIVVRFSVSEMSSIHARVLDHLVDVYGFNITYEFLEPQNTDIKRTCSMHGCSYLGNCYASADFSEYKCHCFEGYFGRDCQFGPHCNPSQGVNMCKNGGQCRYFYGSSVNVCNCTDGYMGYQCEIPLSDLRQDACASLGCMQSCVDDVNKQKKCSCYPDFRLNSDNKTCAHIDRSRITLTVYPVPDYINNVTTDDELPQLSRQMIRGLRKDVKKILRSDGITTIRNFSVDGYRVTKQTELVFHFSIEDSEKDRLSTAVENLDSVSELGEIQVENGTLTYKVEPELYLKDVASSVTGGELWSEFYGNSATEGKFLTLSCLARGSENTQFRWFKDGYPIDINLSSRNSHQTLIHSKREETIRSVLHFEHVTPYDRGVFTCEARSLGSAQNRSELVNVITLPLVDIDPLTDSVPVNGSISIRCLSIDDTLDTFIYEWFEDGKLIKPGRQDKIPEKLIPTGYQLYVRYLEKSTVFTCKVTNEAGPVVVTSHIFVQPVGKFNETCPRQWYKDVIWQKTVGRHYEKQRCPLEAGGYATRKCKCDGINQASCKWEEPNFSKCQSVPLVQIYDQLEMLRLGYQSTTIKAVYDNLSNFLNKANFTFFSGDIDMAASILRELLAFLQKFPIHAQKSEKISAKSIVLLLDKMLRESNSTTLEEKGDVDIGNKILGTVELLASNLMNYLKLDIDSEVNTLNIDMIIEEDAHVYKHEPAELVMEMENNPSKNGLTSKTDSDESLSVSVMKFHFRKLETFLLAKVKEKKLLYSNPVSELVSIHPFPTNNYSSLEIYAHVHIPLKNPSYRQKFVHFSCLSWETFRYSVDYFWSNDSCTLLSTDDAGVHCRCKIPGHFIAVGLTDNKTVISESPSTDISLFLLIGCIVTMCGLTASLITILFRWRELVGEEYILHLNFIISLIGVNCVLIVCISKPEVEIVCVIVRVLVYWFYLAAFVFSLADSVHTFIFVRGKGRIGRYCYKYLAAGWGTPVVLTIFFVVTSEMFGNDKECSELCWITRSHWQFYSFLVPVIVAIVAILTAMVLTLKLCMSLADEWYRSNRRKIMIRSGKSVIFLVLLTTVSFLSTDIKSKHQQAQIILLVTSKLLLNYLRCSDDDIRIYLHIFPKDFRRKMIAVFILRVFFDKKMSMMCWTSHTKTSESEDNSVGLKKQSNNAFKAYIKPERVKNSGIGKEQESVHKYYTRVNRAKYTRERKRELSSLLGSSTSGSLTNSSVGSYLSSHYSTNNTGSTSLKASTPNTGSESELGSRNNDSACTVNFKDSEGRTFTIPQVHVHNPPQSNGPLKVENASDFNKEIINSMNQAQLIQNRKNRKNGYNKNGITKPNYDDNATSENEELSNLLHSLFEEKPYST